MCRRIIALDELSGWHVQRLCFPWDGKKERTIRELTFTLWENPFEALGQEFSPEQSGRQHHVPPAGRAADVYAHGSGAAHRKDCRYFEETLYTTELAYDIAPEAAGWQRDAARLCRGNCEFLARRFFRLRVRRDRRGGRTGCVCNGKRHRLLAAAAEEGTDASHGRSCSAKSERKTRRSYCLKSKKEREIMKFSCRNF